MARMSEIMYVFFLLVYSVCGNVVYVSVLYDAIYGKDLRLDFIEFFKRGSWKWRPPAGVLVSSTIIRHLYLNQIIFKGKDCTSLPQFNLCVYVKRVSVMQQCHNSNYRYATHYLTKSIFHVFLSCVAAATATIVRQHTIVHDIQFLFGLFLNIICVIEVHLKWVPNIYFNFSVQSSWWWWWQWKFFPSLLFTLVTHTREIATLEKLLCVVTLKFCVFFYLILKQVFT